MVFDKDPHGNRDIPLYFLRNLYAEFIWGNMITILLEFQGVGHGIPQDREGARTDPNHGPSHPHTPKPPRAYPPTGPMIDDTHEALFDLAYTLLQHGTVVQGVGTSEVGPSHTQDPHTRSPDHTRGIDRTRHTEGSEHYVIPHPCTVCG